MLFYCSECLHCADLKIMLWLRLLVQKDACWQPAWQKSSRTLQVHDCSPQSLLSHSRLTDYITQFDMLLSLCVMNRRRCWQCCDARNHSGIHNQCKGSTGSQLPAAWPHWNSELWICLYFQSKHMCVHHVTTDVTQEISGICECYEHWSSVCSGKMAASDNAVHCNMFHKLVT